MHEPVCPERRTGEHIHGTLEPLAIACRKIEIHHKLRKLGYMDRHLCASGCCVRDATTLPVMWCC
jgi:hypothetical protein